MPRDAVSADTVVVELEAKMEGYQRDVAQGANAFDQSMKKIASSASDAERSTGQAFKGIAEHSGNARVAQQMLMHVGRSTADQFAAGAPPMMIFTGHLAQMAEAATFAGGSMGKVGAFLGGPWGIALTLATTVAGTLVAKLMEGGNETEKALKKLQEHAHQSDVARIAQDLFAKTVAGATQAIHEENDALEKQNRTLADNAALAKQAALNNLRTATEDRDKVRKDLFAATQELAAAKDAMGGAGSASAALSGPVGAAALARYEAARKTVADLVAQLDKLDTAITQGQRDVRMSQFPVAEDQARRAADRIAAINGKYDDMAAAAKKAAAGNNQLAKSLAATLTQIERQRQAALKLEQDSRRSGRGMSGREVTSAEAASIARAAGLQVNSASRSYSQQKALYDAWVSAGMPQDNPVAKPGTSAHEGARGRWALDIQLGNGVTPELLRKVFAAQGISLTKVFLERGHFHIEGSRAQADAEQAARDAGTPTTTAAQLRDQFYRQAEEDIAKRPLRLFDTDDLTEQADQVGHISDQTADLASLLASFPPIPDLSKMLPEEEQRRLDEWASSFEQDLSSSLVSAIEDSKSLGDALVNTFKRAASALLESGILNILSGGKQGVSFASMLTAAGNLFHKTLPPMGNTPGLASGGHATAGKLYRVNERGSGTEYWQPAGQGKVIPLGSPALSQGGNMTVVNSVHVNANDAVLADTVRAWVAQAMQEAAARGAIGGRTMTLDYLRRQNRQRLA